MKHHGIVKSLKSLPNNNFKHDLITPRSPIANSEVKRVMQTISKAYERGKILKDGLWRENMLT